MTMTIEEKVKAYDKALERARERYEKVPDSVLGLNLVGIFPELAESEDDKIRYFLINFVKINDGVNISPDDAKKALAWLEKQGKQNLANSAKTCKNEQTLAEKQEHPINYKEAEKACLEYRKFREECGIKDPVMLDEIEEAYYNGATSIQKHVWSDEDEENLQHCCGAIGAADYYTVEDKQDMIDWLKSLKE